MNVAVWHWMGRNGMGVFSAVSIFGFANRFPCPAQHFFRRKKDHILFLRIVNAGNAIEPPSKIDIAQLNQAKHDMQIIPHYVPQTNPYLISPQAPVFVTGKINFVRIVRNRKARPMLRGQQPKPEAACHAIKKPTFFIVVAIQLLPR